MKREYLTTEQGEYFIREMNLDAFLMFTIQELNDYIRQYEIEGINNAVALLVQAECQNNEELSNLLKIDPSWDRIIVEENPLSANEDGIVFFDVYADVGKKKLKSLGQVVAIDYYNCIPTIIESGMLVEDQAISADEVIREPEPVIEEIPESLEAVEENIEESIPQTQEQPEEIIEEPMSLESVEENIAIPEEQVMHERAPVFVEEVVREEIPARPVPISMPIDTVQEENIEYREIYADQMEIEDKLENEKYFANNNNFMNKVHYAKTHGYEGHKEYELYDNSRQVPTQFQPINYREQDNNLSLPRGPEDIIIEDIDKIGNSGYIPYPFGPLKRPPVPYDL